MKKVPIEDLEASAMGDFEVYSALMRHRNKTHRPLLDALKDVLPIAMNTQYASLSQQVSMKAAKKAMEDASFITFVDLKEVPQ